MLDNTHHVTLDDHLYIELGFDSLRELLLSPPEQAAAFGQKAKNESDILALKAALSQGLTPDVRELCDLLNDIAITAHFAFGTDDILRDWLDEKCEKLGRTPRESLVSSDPHMLKALLRVVEEMVESI